MNRLAVALALLAATRPAAAQEMPRPSFGVGIGVVAVEVGNTHTIEVYFPIRVTPQLRLEPSLGVLTNDQREDVPGSTDRSNVTVGAGLFYVMPVAPPTDVYVGGRVKLNFATRDTQLDNESENDFTLAFAVGGEHYFSPRFSLGAEGQLGTYQNGKVSGLAAANDHGYFTTGVAFVRFYFQ